MLPNKTPPQALKGHLAKPFGQWLFNAACTHDVAVVGFKMLDEASCFCRNGRRLPKKLGMLLVTPRTCGCGP
eukprot:2267232-Lingulodinium_polyedra.AAC.1